MSISSDFVSAENSFYTKETRIVFGYCFKHFYLGFDIRNLITQDTFIG